MAGVVAILSDVQSVGDQRRYTVDVVPVDTVVKSLGALPIVIPPLGDGLDLDLVLDRIDGLLIPGGLTNVYPPCYGRPADKKFGPFDVARDATALPLIQAALARGVPVLLTCRGFQELNVALGGTLTREPDDAREEAKHGTPKSARTEDERYRLRQYLNVSKGGRLSAILGAERALVNSLHSQVGRRSRAGIDRRRHCRRWHD